MAWRYYFGLFLLVIGLGYLLEQMHFIANFQFIDILSTWWPLIIVGVGVNQFVRHKEQPWGSLIVFTLGIVMMQIARNAIPLHPNPGSHLAGIPVLPTWKSVEQEWGKLLLAILLMSLAMRMMVSRGAVQYQSANDAAPASAKARFDHTIRDRQVFGSTHFRNDSQQFIGGKLGAFLGDYELDLRGAALATGGAQLRVQSIFGTMRIRVPQQMVLDVSGAPVLAGVANSTKQIVSKADGLPTLKIRYFALFGAVEITN